LKEAVERMKPFFTDKSPFVNTPNIKEKIQWVQPKLVCEIEYAELTADGPAAPDNVLRMA
jgi:bifunctional non-homologous end joining protein LigD